MQRRPKDTYEALDVYDEGLKVLGGRVRSAGNPVSDVQMVTINQLCDGMKATHDMLREFYIEMSSDQQSRFQDLVQKHENILKDYVDKGPRIAPTGIR